MALSTYAQLQGAIADYLARSDLTEQIKDFITLAELRLSRDLRIRQMLTYTSLSTVAATATVNLPSDYLQLKDLHLATDPVTALGYLTPANFFRNTTSTVSGRPHFYTTTGTQFIFAPIPDTVLTVKILYYAKPAVLSDANTSNVFLANCPDALLYAALGEAEPYLMNDPRLATWAALYDKALASINASDDAGEASGSPLSIAVALR